MSSLGIFDKETKTYKKIAGLAEAAAVDDALSSTSTNPVQNKVVTSNLTDLKYGEVAGGKNLLNPNKTIIGELVDGTVGPGEQYISDYIPIKSETSYSISNCTQGSHEVAWYTSDKTYISRSFTTPVTSPSNASYVRIEYTDNINAQLEEGSVATSYEPYIPSVKMLAEEKAEKADKSETTVNLLNPTLQTSTQNGVTCTHNGDGTYTVNGTNTSADTTVYFTLSDTLIDLAKKMVNKKLKLVGCPAGGSDSTFDLQYEINSVVENGGGYDFGNGVVVNNDKIAAENITKASIYIAVRPGYTADNLVFKPMLTTNLSATYYDFVPYTGDTGKLNGDVAELKAQSVKKDDVTENVKIDGKTIFLNSNGELSAKSDEPALKIVTFANGTNEEIAKMIQAHYNNKINISDYWAVGDTRTVHLSAMAATGVDESHRAQTVQFVIGDFEHDDLTTPINGHSKAAVTLLQKDCLMDASNDSNNTENGYMNSSNTNVGGWKNCARRTWCNNVFFAALPSVWQSMVKTVNKKTSVGNNQSTIETVQDKIFLAAEIEIFGSTPHSVPGEGTQYQYYKNATANRYKMPKWDSSSVSNTYFERSPYNSDTSRFCVMNSDGRDDYNLAYSPFGIALCLCI